MRNETGLIDVTASPVQTIDFDGDYTPFIAHIQQVCGWANSQFNNLPIRLSANYLMAQNAAGMLDLSDSSGAMARFCQDQKTGRKTDGILHEPQVKTAAETIAKAAENLLAKNMTALYVVLGAMQCGKTGTCNFLNFIAPILYLLTGEKFFPMYVLTNRSAQVAQAVNERNTFMGLYNLIEISLLDQDGDIKKTTTLREIMNNAKTLLTYQNSILKRITREAAELQPTLDMDIKSIIKNNDSVNDETTAVVMQQRSPAQARMNIVRQVCQTAGELNVNVIFIIDEVHWGAQDRIVNEYTESESGAVLARMLLPVLKEVQEFKHTQYRHLLIGVSATPYQTVYLEASEVIRHRLGVGYCGPNFFDGEPIDPNPDLNLVLPEIVSLSEAAEAVGFCGLPSLSVNNYVNKSAFVRWKKREGKNSVFETWEDYRATYIEVIKAVIERELLVENERPLALCLRAINSNGDKAKYGMRDFITELGLDPEIRVEFFDSSNERKGVSTKDFYDSVCAENKRVLLVVTGAARMADAFPTQAKLNGVLHPLRWTFLNLTNQTVKQASLLQDLYGRACGYGKIIDGYPPRVIASDKNAEKYREYHEARGRLVMAPTPDTVLLGKGSGKEYDHLPIMKDMAGITNDSIIQGAFAAMEKAFAKPLKDRANLQGYKAPSGELWDILDESVITHVETKVPELFPLLEGNPGLLRPNRSEQEDIEAFESEMPFYDVDHETGYGGFSLRSVDADDIKTGGGIDLTDRDARRIAAKSGGRSLVDVAKARREDGDNSYMAYALKPQIFVYRNPKTKRWEVRGIVLQLNQPVRERIYGTHALPLGAEGGSKSTFSGRLRSESEVAAVMLHIENCQSRKRKKTEVAA